MSRVGTEVGRNLHIDRLIAASTRVTMRPDPTGGGELTEVDGGTRLVFTDQLDATFAARNAAGWDVCLELLDGRTAPEDLWTARFDRYVEAFEPAIGPQVGPPERP